MKSFPCIDMEATGKQIRALRRAKGLRVEDVSNYMGFTGPQAVYKWQRGDCLPEVENLLALSRLFEIPIENILKEREEEGEQPSSCFFREIIAVYYEGVIIMSKTIMNKVMRYIVPFSFDISYDEAVEILDSFNSGKFKLERDIVDRAGGSESDVYDYIRNEFRYSESENRNKLGCMFKAVLDGNNPPLQLVTDSKLFSNEIIGKSDIFILENLQILLGRNGIGFFFYSFKKQNSPNNGNADQIDIDELVEFQNRFKELCRNDQELSFWNKVTITKANRETVQIPSFGIKEEKVINGDVKEYSYYEPFFLGSWISDILSVINVKFTAERKNPSGRIVETLKKRDLTCIERTNYRYSVVDSNVESSYVQYIPDKALLFSYCAFEESENFDETETVQNLIYLCNGYKNSYAIKKDAVNDVFMPFANVFWYTTQEGCAGVAMPKAESREFLQNGLLSKVKEDYFTLYVKCLFQSYSLLKYAERIQNELSAVRSDYTDAAEDNSFEDLTGAINVFLTKSMATSVSHITHQSDFYIYLKNRLHVQDDVTSVTSGLESLSEIQKSNVERKEAEKSDRIQAIIGLFSVLAIVSALLDAHDLLQVLMPECTLFSELSGHPVYIAIYIIVFAIIICISIIATVFAFKAIRSTRSKKNKKGKKK